MVPPPLRKPFSFNLFQKIPSLSEPPTLKVTSTQTTQTPLLCFDTNSHTASTTQHRRRAPLNSWKKSVVMHLPKQYTSLLQVPTSSKSIEWSIKYLETFFTLILYPFCLACLLNSQLFFYNLKTLPNIWHSLLSNMVLLTMSC